jgi:chemotaxis protein CheX
LLTSEEETMTATAVAKPSPQENWLPTLVLATQEVFEVVLGCKVKQAEPSSEVLKGGFTAIVGLAGALCGVVTVCCAAATAELMAKGMLGDATVSQRQVVDALGEMCNMIAGNFKNKLAGTDERSMLSVPTVISGGQYSLHSLADGQSVESVLLYEDARVTVRLQLQG